MKVENEKCSSKSEIIIITTKLKTIESGQEALHYPGFGFRLTISSGIWSSSHGRMFFSFSRAFIFDTTFLRSCTTAEARGSIVFMTQLHDVSSFSVYFDKSDAEISINAKNHNEKNHTRKYMYLCECVLQRFSCSKTIFRDARLLTRKKSFL